MVHARVGRAHVQPGQVDQFVQLISAEVVPSMKQQRGFVAASVSTGANNQVLTVGLWESEADLIASETSYLRDSLAKLAPLLAGQPTFERYEAPIWPERREGTYARLTPFQIDPSQIDAALEAFQGVAESIQQQRGAGSTVLLVQRATGRALGAAIFDTMANLEAYGQKARPLLLAKLAPFLTEPPGPPEVYQVRLRV